MHHSRDLYRDDDLVVRLVPRRDRTRWVVTFDCHTHNRSLDRAGFGESFFADRRISAAHVVHRGNHWYQYAGMAAALAAIARRLEGAARVVTYGSSMGGYAALRFAGAVGADAALALSPQYSIDRAVMPAERRWHQEAATVTFLPALEGAIAPVPTMVVAYDPHDPDRAQVDRIAADVPIVRLPLPYLGHPVTTYLGRHRLLEPLLLSLLEDRFDADAARAQVLEPRKDSPLYLAELARRQPPHRAATAVALGRKAVALAPEDGLYKSMLARRLTEVGQHEEALRLHADAVAESQRFAGYLLAQGEAMLASGDADGARAIGDGLTREHPDYAVHHALRARAAAAQGDWPAAEASALEAIRLDPAGGWSVPRPPSSPPQRLLGRLRSAIGDSFTKV